MSILVMGKNVHNAHQPVKAKCTSTSCILHTMTEKTFDDRPETAQRLEEARVARGYETAKQAAEAHGWRYDTYAQHENGTRGISRAVNDYARAFKVDASWLLFNQGRGPDRGEASPPGLRRVTVAAHIQAGAWAEAWEWSADDHYNAYVPDDPDLRGVRLYAAETRGPSMNRRYPEGTVLVFTNVQETREPPIPGKRYIVERRRSSGEMEHTVKLLFKDAEGKFWLVPESDDPRHQAAISIDEGLSDGDTVVIVGRVHYAISKE